MRIFPLAFVLLVSSVGHAEPRITELQRTCAEVSPQGLDETYRMRAQQLLARTLEQANLLVVERDCTETYRIEFAAENRTLILDGPGARVSRALGDTGDLAIEYATLIGMQRAMRQRAAAEAAHANDPAPTDAAPIATARAPIATASAERVDEPEGWGQAAEPERPAVSTLFYFRYGLGTVASAGPGAAVSLGLRHTFAHADVDISLAGVAGSAQAFRVEVLSTPAANRSAFYAGGGLAGSSVETNYETNEGFSAELTGGVALSASHKWFLQADLSLPFFSTPVGYPATFSMSIGYGLATH